MARSGAAKGTICDVDAKFGANAGTYGISRRKGRSFVQIGNRCSFVAALTDEARTVSEGNKAHFKTNSAGKVIDPYHPNISAVRSFVARSTARLCSAVIRQLAN